MININIIKRIITSNNEFFLFPDDKFYVRIDLDDLGQCELFMSHHAYCFNLFQMSLEIPK